MEPLKGVIFSQWRPPGDGAVYLAASLVTVAVGGCRGDDRQYVQADITIPPAVYQVAVTLLG